MKLAILTKPIFFVEEHNILTSLFEEGMDNLHLRKPNSSPLYSERLFKLLPDRCYSKITLHEYFYLKNEYNLGGIHLDNYNIKIPENYKGAVGVSCSEISELKVLKKKYKYVFLRNVFNSEGFSDGITSFSVPQLKEAARKGLIDKKVYALGGINLDNIQMIKDLGFGGAVVCEDLWNRFNIHEESDFKGVISHFYKLRKAVD